MADRLAAEGLERETEARREAESLRVAEAERKASEVHEREENSRREVERQRDVDAQRELASRRQFEAQLEQAALREAEMTRELAVLREAEAQREISARIEAEVQRRLQAAAPSHVASPVPSQPAKPAFNVPADSAVWMVASKVPAMAFKPTPALLPSEIEAAEEARRNEGAAHPSSTGRSLSAMPPQVETDGETPGADTETEAVKPHHDRKHKRVSSRTPATIWCNGMPQAMSCTMRDRSSGGALIELPPDPFNAEISSFGIGDTVTLTFQSPQERTSVVCTVMRIKGRQCGLKFSGQFNTQSLKSKRTEAKAEPVAKTSGLLKAKTDPTSKPGVLLKSKLGAKTEAAAKPKSGFKLFR